MLSRYGDTYSKVTPDDAKEREKFLKAQAAIVAKVNAPEGSDIARIVNATGGGLRRVYTEIENEEGASMMTKIEMDAMNAVIGIQSSEEFFISEGRVMQIIRRMIRDGATVGGASIPAAGFSGFRTSRKARLSDAERPLFP